MRARVADDRPARRSAARARTTAVGVSWSTVNPFGGRPMVQFVGWPGELGGDGSDVGSIRPGRVRAQPSARLNAR
jgi:hypothetical protein